MLYAGQARLIKDAMRRGVVETDVYRILKEIAAKALESSGGTQVSDELQYVDERVEIVASRFRELGYQVSYQTYTEDGFTSISVKF